MKMSVCAAIVAVVLAGCQDARAVCDGKETVWLSAADALLAVWCPVAEASADCPFERLGAMLDVSRGRVLTVDCLKGRFDRMRKMGYNAVMLYTEDTFPLEGEPKWGYLRGGYSKDDVRALKSHADKLGLEMIP